MTSQDPSRLSNHDPLGTDATLQLMNFKTDGNMQDTNLSIRFKYGNQTIFMFVDSAQPFSSIQEELLGILEERYPDGITKSTLSSRTRLPRNASQIKFALPKNKADLTHGWKPLANITDETPQSQGFKNNATVAFAFAADDMEDADDIEFEVELPSYEEDYDGRLNDQE